ncbi:MAG: hypothetical protein BWY74_00162 [Firmicutes bacterium ADurb.Bin419]|nr:MAG: hypothetical protein BWY74_00162 [Firmicutes bacterium ADurb.Bin419]
MTTKEKKLYQKVLDRFDSAEDNQKDLFKKFSRLEKIYDAVFDKTPITGSKAYIPTGWSSVETLIPRLLNRKPIIHYIPGGAEDIDRAKKLSRLFSYWYEKTGAFFTMVNWLKSALIYGTSFARLDWEFKICPRKFWSASGDNYLVSEEVVVEMDDPKLRLIDNYNIFVDPSATNIDEARWIIERIYTTVESLEKENEDMKYLKERLLEKGETEMANSIVLYSNLSEVKRANKGSIEREEYERDKKELSDLDSTAMDNTVNEVALLEMWDMQTKETVLIDTVSGEIIRKRSFPYWHYSHPYLVAYDSIKPLSLWGKGELEPIEKVQHVINTITNQKVDNINYILNFMWKARPTIDDDELVPEQGGIIHVSDMNDVEPLNMPHVTQDAHQELAYWDGVVQNVLGINDYIRGLGQSGDQTAAEVQIKTQQANFRFQHKIQLFEDYTLKKLGNMVLALYQQHLTDEKILKIFGENGMEFERLTPEDLLGQYDAMPEAGSSAPDDEQTTKEQLMNFYMLVKDDPMWNKTELAKKVAEKFGFKNVELILNNDGGGMGDEIAMMQQLQGAAPQPTQPEAAAPPEVEGAGLLSPQDLAINY